MGKWGLEKWGWSPRWNGERERVHWSELGHQGKVRREDEKEMERENEGGKGAFHSGSHGIVLLSSWREGWVFFILFCFIFLGVVSRCL